MSVLPEGEEMASGMDPEFIEPTASSRRNLAMFLIAALVLGIGLIELLQTQLDEMKARPICDSITMFRWWWTLALGGLALCGAWVAWLAQRALKLNQWPLPGTWVFRRTLIRRGNSARWLAYGMLGWSVLAIVGSGISWYVGEELVQRVESQRCVQQS